MTGAMTLASIGFLYGAPIPNLAVMVSTGSATVRHYTAAGTLVQTLTGGAGFMTGSVFDTSGNFYVTDFSGNVVKKYDNNAVFLNTQRQALLRNRLSSTRRASSSSVRSEGGFAVFRRPERFSRRISPARGWTGLT